MLSKTPSSNKAKDCKPTSPRNARVLPFEGFLQFYYHAIVERPTIVRRDFMEHGFTRNLEKCVTNGEWYRRLRHLYLSHSKCDDKNVQGIIAEWTWEDAEIFSD